MACDRLDCLRVVVRVEDVAPVSGWHIAFVCLCVFVVIVAVRHEFWLSDLERKQR